MNIVCSVFIIVFITIISTEKQPIAFKTIIINRHVRYSKLILSQINDNLISKEIEKQRCNIKQLPSFSKHRKAIEELSKIKELELSTDDLFRQDLLLYHFSSNFDELEPEDNTNINDKFWRTALKYGKVNLRADTPIEIKKFGPFVEESQIENLTLFM